MSIIKRMELIEAELAGMPMDQIVMLPDATMLGIEVKALTKAAHQLGIAYDPEVQVSLNYWENNQQSRFLSLPGLYRKDGQCWLTWGDGVKLTGEFDAVGAKLLQGPNKSIVLAIARVPFRLAIEGDLDEALIYELMEAETFEELAPHLREKIDTIKLAEAMAIPELCNGLLTAKKYEKRDKSGWFAKGRFVPASGGGPFLAYLPDAALDGLIEGREYPYVLGNYQIQLKGLGTFEIGVRAHKLSELEEGSAYTFVDWKCSQDKYWSIQRNDGVWFSANSIIKKVLQLDPVITREQPATFEVTGKRPFGAGKVQVSGIFNAHIPHEGPSMAELMAQAKQPPNPDHDDLPF